MYFILKIINILLNPNYLIFFLFIFHRRKKTSIEIILLFSRKYVFQSFNFFMIQNIFLIIYCFITNIIYQLLNKERKFKFIKFYFENPKLSYFK